jgi:hypothetical protein
MKVGNWEKLKAVASTGTIFLPSLTAVYEFAARKRQLKNGKNIHYKITKSYKYKSTQRIKTYKEQQQNS